ncbi:hypothetical protein Agabi119p4_10329 [Agaricus bisporus var. burnettii]|uniref:Urea carboxylase n=1 Tax=Agaricus bisporus var. burnettii TaxID=192524 RepID=A0A8H7C2S3_AGABI|nr:hypothetical protein Agabi119p4_10329 [Agaricus bisporus var. burnettii]
MTSTNRYEKHTLLIANRGEIALRIIRSAKKLALRTVSIYTPADATAPHVTLADTAVALPLSSGTNATEGTSYLNPEAILDICKSHNVTLVHPGYGFLSENAEFAEMVEKAGMGWLGPRGETIKLMGLKHLARDTVKSVGLGVVPGSDGLVEGNVEDIVKKIGLPVIFKASAGGGGLGMVVCEKMEDIGSAFEGARSRAKTLFGNDGVFIERYIPRARHVEVQVFGDGEGNVIHLRERECSTQRRHQKVIEECPSPFLEEHPGLRERMCNAAVTLCRAIRYESAGTVEFLVDDASGAFYFLEMNTRIQVEHPITEVTHDDLDLIEMMIAHTVAKKIGERSPVIMDQAHWDSVYNSAKANGRGFAIEGRIYAENPAERFLPSPGLLQHVRLEENYPWLRIDSWISTGTQVTLHFDPMLSKIIVSGRTREEAISRFLKALEECQVCGPPNNMDYLRAIATSSTFMEGRLTTRFLDILEYTPSVMKVMTAGLEMTVQDLPGRLTGKGIPKSGPMDPIAFSVGNVLVGNDRNTEGLEIIVVPGVPARFKFTCGAVVAITGREIQVKLNGKGANAWSRLVVPADGILEISVNTERGRGDLRSYLAILGGFPNVPQYLGSKSTSMGLGGYQGRSLLPGDILALRDSPELLVSDYTLPQTIVPTYPRNWIVYVLAGPQDDEEFVTEEGIARFYLTQWQVSPSSGRTGIRLESSEKIRWARESGGQGGGHPSNILDNAYARGSVNINGDTPIILGNEGPDMGGYICLCVVATGELWKLGQISPGDTITFRRVSHARAAKITEHNDNYIAGVENIIKGEANSQLVLYDDSLKDEHNSPKLYQSLASEDGKVPYVLRQAGDSAILVEFGIIELDFFVRARVQVLLEEIQNRNIVGVNQLCPCIRSIMIHYDNHLVSQADLVQHILSVIKTIPHDLTHLSFKGRRITFPIVLDDPWSKEATERYMRSIREKAVYLPSNVDYIANNNGLSGSKEALDKLMASDWIVFGVGFYLGCPFLVPIDPRCRLTGQKLNPSRTFTPRGAVGIAGPVTAIYPVESPGGYQLFGRTIPAWQAWGKGGGFSPERPWLLDPFDQVRFEPVDIETYQKWDILYEQGRYPFKIEPTVFSMTEYAAMVGKIQDEVSTFRERQLKAMITVGERERILLSEWEKENSQRASQSANTEGTQGDETNVLTIKTPLFASVWKICCKVGDTITSLDEPLLLLEAMKTEIPIKAEEIHLGQKIKAFGPAMKEGALVKPGDVLITVITV